MWYNTYLVQVERHAVATIVYTRSSHMQEPQMYLPELAANSYWSYEYYVHTAVAPTRHEGTYILPYSSTYPCNIRVLFSHFDISAGNVVADARLLLFRFQQYKRPIGELM